MLRGQATHPPIKISYRENFVGAFLNYGVRTR